MVGHARCNASSRSKLEHRYLHRYVLAIVVIICHLCPNLSPASMNKTVLQEGGCASLALHIPLHRGMFLLPGLDGWNTRFGASTNMKVDIL